MDYINMLIISILSTAKNENYIKNYVTVWHI